MRLRVQDKFSNDYAADTLFVKQVCWNVPRYISTHYGNCGHSLMLSITSYAKMIWNRKLQHVFFLNFSDAEASLMKRHVKGENRMVSMWSHAKPKVELDHDLLHMLLLPYPLNVRFFCVHGACTVTNLFRWIKRTCIHLYVSHSWLTTTTANRWGLIFTQLGTSPLF